MPQNQPQACPSNAPPNPGTILAPHQVCPFCGHDQLCLVRRGESVYVRCLACIATGPVRAEETDALNRWNTRQPQRRENF